MPAIADILWGCSRTGGSLEEIEVKSGIVVDTFEEILEATKKNMVH